MNIFYSICVALFYQYLLWKGKDTAFLSNALPAGVARAVGAPGLRKPATADTSSATTSSTSLPAGSSSSSNGHASMAGQGMSNASPSGAIETGGGQPSIPGSRKRKAAEAKEERKEQTESMGIALTTSLTSALSATVVPSPTSKEAKRKNTEATTDLRAAQAELVRAELRMMDSKIAEDKRAAEVNRIQAVMNQPNVYEKLSEAQKTAINDRLYNLLICSIMSSV